MTPTEKIIVIQGIIGTDPDGEWGPLSESALRKVIRKSQEVPDPTPIPPPSGTVHPFVAVAEPWMGTEETSPNHFPGMEKLWKDTSYQDGWENREPYCAAFQCHVVAEARRRGAKVQGLPMSASVREFRAWARARGYTVTTPKPGDQFTLLPSGTSHMGLVEAVDGDLIHTLEGNTDGAGSRDGDGFWRKVRKIASCDFIRIPVA